MMRLAAPLVAFWQRQSVRDRRLLAALLLGAAIAAELLLVLPTRGRRLAVAAAVEADAQARAQGTQDATQALSTARRTLETELAAIDAELRRIDGGSAQREPLASLMRRTVTSQGLTLLGLRALAVQELTLGAAAPAPDAAMAPAAADPAASAAAATTVFRHRVELRLTGPALPLLERLDALVAELAPLRVERVTVAAGSDGAVAATLVLFTIAAERTWLEL